METWLDIVKWYDERNCVYAANAIQTIAREWSSPQELATAIEQGLDLCRRRNSGFAIRRHVVGPQTGQRFTKRNFLGKKRRPR